jgi:hypothetical protein
VRHRRGEAGDAGRIDVTPLPVASPPAQTFTAAPSVTLPVFTRPPAPSIGAPRPGGISVTVPAASSVAAADIERMAARAHDELARTLATSVLPITIRLHDTLDSFRLATNRPWWVSELAEGTAIDLAPASVLAQRGGLDAAIRLGVAELLVAGPLAGRPEWVRAGAARYFAQGSAAVRPASARTRCPSDAELLLAVSATAQREAQSRAEACFARELAKTRDWRSVR